MMARNYAPILAAAVLAGALVPLACGNSGLKTASGGTSTGGASPGVGGAGGSGGDGGLVINLDGGAGGSVTGTVLSNVHIVPANATITVQAGQTATEAYKVMGTVNGAATETDVTSSFVFWVPDNYLVGDFPLSGGPLFTTRLPVLATDPPQQGGALTVEAEALNPGNVKVIATTSLTVQLVASLDYPSGGAGLPANPGTLFGGTNDPTRAPVLEYPNNGTMLPPNLQVLDVHWLPGSAKNTVYQVTFQSAAASVTYYTACGTLGGLMTAGACGFQLDATGYGYLSQSNAGAGNVALTIKGTDSTGTSVGTSATFQLQFAQQAVNGGVYYWDVTDTRIMRFDFGGTLTAPQVFLSPGQYGTSGTCIGCHALSPDGTKMAASAGGQNSGLLEYIADVAAPTTPLTATDDDVNRIQFASFSPLGEKFVAVYGDGAPGTNPALTPQQPVVPRRKHRRHHPGDTKPLAFEPDHPAWSPDGTMIAMTHVGVHNTSQREYLGGIDVATFAAGAVTDGGVLVGDAGAALGDPVVVVPSNVMTGGNAVNSYNPSFAPDSSFMVFSQTICTAAQAQTDVCDSDVANNVSGTTWAVKPSAGATPVHLDNGAAPGRGRRRPTPTSSTPSRGRRRSRRRRARASSSGSPSPRSASRGCG